MKKTICMIACLLTISLLSACGEEKVQLPEWTGENELYAETFTAITEELSADQKDKKEEENTLQASDFLLYDKDRKIPCFDFTAVTPDEAERIGKALKEVWDGRDIPMWGAKISEDDPGADMLAFFAGFNCKSIKLTLPVVCDNSESSSGLSAGNIRELTELVVDEKPIEISAMWGTSPMTPCERLTDLTCISRRELDFSLQKWFPKLERLTLLCSEDSYPPNDLAQDLSGLPVTEVSYLNPDGSAAGEGLETVEFYESLIALDQIQKINGTDKEQFEIPMDDATRANYEDQKLREEADGLVETVKEKLRNCEGIDTDREEGTPKLGRKIIARVDSSDDGDWSLYCALAGKDYEGIPNDRLAKNYEEADTYLYVHDYNYPVGTYTNGAIAYKTYTMVITFDLKNGSKRAAKCIGVEDPPETITSYNNIPTLAGSGKFLADDAMKYVKKLL